MGKSWLKVKEHSKRGWRFFWHDDSALSWIVNIVVAFLVIRFLVYPLLGLLLGTSFPIVAVVSESMEHGLHNGALCGESIPTFRESFDNYWEVCGMWYESHNITKDEFKKFHFAQGFRKGDVIILWRANPSNIEIGDVLVFQSDKPQPIIHRVVKTWIEDGSSYYQTKGDHNSESIRGSLAETKIHESRIYGKGLVRIPYLGWLKIVFVDALSLVGITIDR